MLHYAAFHQIFTIYLRKKKTFSDAQIQLQNDNLTPQDMYNGLSLVYWIKPVRRIHYYTKD